MSSSILTVSNLDVAYGDVQVVFDMNMHINNQELVGLVGGNGSGKSTILRVISGMLKPKKGSIKLEQKEIGGVTPHELTDLGAVSITCSTAI